MCVDGFPHSAKLKSWVGWLWPEKLTAIRPKDMLAKEAGPAQADGLLRAGTRQCASVWNPC